jgi:hypothetical protein
MNRTQWALPSLIALVLLVPPRAQAQQSQDMQRAYQQRRAQLQRETEETARRLSELRSQRVELQARLEGVIAADLRNRAQQLMMSNEQNALQGLDSILVASQDNLLAQRDRFRALGEAVRARTGAVLVVLLRADSAQTQTVANAELAVNNGVVATRTYSGDANIALRLGAVDEMYRADVLPTRLSVRATVNVNGQALTQSVDVNAQGETVTYVQFAVRNGQLVPTTWTSRGTTPF